MKKNWIWVLIITLLVSSCGLNFDEPTEKPGQTETGTTENPNSQPPNSQKPDESESESDSSEETYTFTELSEIMWVKGDVNVRDLPKAEGKKLGTLLTNDKVNVTGQCVETKWYRIEFENGIGYVNSEYLEKLVETTMYATTTVNVRSGPSASATKLGALSQNDSVVALGQAVDGWQKVIYDNQVAYVSSKYLSTEKIAVGTDELLAEDFVIPELNGTGPIIVIDAGHQGKQNSGKEPIGPGATTTKAKVAAGTSGCVTGLKEYILTLDVAMMLKEELTARGYQVVMIRETHQFNMSNAQRALVANKINADAFIRIHANGSTDAKVKGALTMCQTASNPYNGEFYKESRKLSECVLNSFAEATGCTKKSIIETDTMSGINWAKVPTTIIEMGFMSNPEEDALMATKDYQKKMVDGMADGLDAYFGY